MQIVLRILFPEQTLLIKINNKDSLNEIKRNALSPYFSSDLRLQFIPKGLHPLNEDELSLSFSDIIEKYKVHEFIVRAEATGA